MEQASHYIRDFLQFITLQFISHPELAQLKVAEAEGNHIRFRLILHQEDVKHMIGRNGFTASSIRNLIKGAAMKSGIQATLQIISHEEEANRLKQLGEGTQLNEPPSKEDYDESHDEELEG